ncbi:aminopeptidase P family protein [Kribbella sp. NPDC050281]|uniref:aminopeptidase P family protein n=1 Tax=Kribbella sp. NPDC050281 TaxID=3155515 RepID=UPI0034069F40
MSTSTTNDHKIPYLGTRPPRLTTVPAFVDSIGCGWEVRTIPAPAIDGAAASAAAHRDRLRAALPGKVVLVAAGRAPVRVNDTSYDFRADSDFLWLTGVGIEDAYLLVGSDASADTLFMPPPFRPGETGFFSDASHGELWVGPSAGITEWSQALGITVRPVTELESAISGAGTVLAGRRVPATELAVERSEDPDRVCSDLRRIKDDWEIGQLRYAVDQTVEGFAAVAREIPAAIGARGPVRGERWLQGTFDRYARAVGNGPGYSTIVGSGSHAPILHWVRCDGPIHEDQALLLDMGVEADSGYTADVTRTLPASGTFSADQRRVHDLVEQAHRAGLAQVRPGNTYSDFHFAAMERIARGLEDWGLLPVSVDEALSPAGQQHRRWLVCGIGHHLGLDVHDCSQSSWETYQGAPLEPDMVLTVEPGLYFHPHDLTVPPELRGVGVRLEDDVLVTSEGSEVLSDALPIDADGLEVWTRERLDKEW